MVAFRITHVLSLDGQLVVRMDHLRGDALWFREAYVFQGREGLRHKIATDGNGDPLLTDGTLVLADADGNHRLPDGKAWDREAIPHLRLASLLSIVRATHARRLAANWPASKQDPILTRPVSSKADRDGLPALRAVFDPLVGQSFDL